MINRVYRSGRLYGFKWGLAGKTYSVKKYGDNGAIARAEKQGRATYTSRGRSMGMFKLPKSMRKMSKSEKKQLAKERYM